MSTKHSDNREFSADLCNPAYLHSKLWPREGKFTFLRVRSSDQEAKSLYHEMPETHVYDFPPISKHGWFGHVLLGGAGPLWNHCASGVPLLLIQIHFIFMNLPV